MISSCLNGTIVLPFWLLIAFAICYLSAIWLRLKVMGMMHQMTWPPQSQYISRDGLWWAGPWGEWKAANKCSAYAASRLHSRWLPDEAGCQECAKPLRKQRVAASKNLKCKPYFALLCFFADYKIPNVLLNSFDVVSNSWQTTKWEDVS